MNIQELVAGLKEKGLSDEEIKAELEKIKASIDEFLNPQNPENPAPAPAEAPESDEDKEHRVFGI